MKLPVASLALLLALGCGRARDAEGPREESPEGEGTSGATGESDPERPVIVSPPLPEPVPPEERGWRTPLGRACGGCHNESTCAGGICDIEDISALIEGGSIIPGDPNESPLYRNAINGHAPPSDRRLTEDEIQDIAQYILRLEPVEPVEPVCQLPYPSWDQLFTALQQDILSQPTENRPFLRYLSLSNHAAAGACGGRLTTGREALDKLINSISQGPEVRRATPVADAAGSGTLFRIDLRDYALDESRGPFAITGSGSYSDGWEAIIASDEYAVEFTGPNADVVVLQAGTSVPVLFVDAFIDKASVGDLYAGLLRLGETRQQVLSALGVDPDASLGDRSAELAGITASDVSRFNRVTTRNAGSAAAYYYENFEMDPDVVGDTVVGDPFAFTRGVAVGSEALFSLPNGFQAFLLFDGEGNRLEGSPTLFDNRQNDNVMRTAISCFGCHAQGPNEVTDEVRAFALANEADVTLAAEAAGFDYQAVLDLYSGAFATSVASDASTYQNALARAGVTASAEDPISSVFLRFDEDPRIADVAGDLLISPAALEIDIPRLNPAFSGLDNGFAVDRDDARAFYVESLCIMLVESANKPTAAACAAVGAPAP